MHKYHPYLTLTRQEWAQLMLQERPVITPQHLEQLRSLNDQITIDEVQEVYFPLAAFLHLQAEAAKQVKAAESQFLKKPISDVPYIIGIAGSVAAGKSTTARLLKAILSTYEGYANIEIVTTDGFLYPNHVLEAKGIMDKKGFPQSYDIRKLIQFLTDIKSGIPEVTAPMYSHLSYDILSNEVQTVRKPAILIIEGINVLQVNRGASVFVSDFFDYSIFVDAGVQDLKTWYLDRFRMLRKTAFLNPQSYFHRYASLSEEESLHMASNVWRNINELNLTENILPTKARAKLILEKGASHTVQNIHLRK